MKLKIEKFNLRNLGKNFKIKFELKKLRFLKLKKI